MTHTEIIDFWYSGRTRNHWFSSTHDLDREIKEKYEHVWERAAAGELDHWQDSPESALALIIILDQFPLNMFRGEPKSFQTERKAVEVALHAIKNGFDKNLSNDKLAFLFMPLMHSEDREKQELSVKLYEEHNLTGNLKFAKHHRDIIRKYGRFPHRNAILSRANTDAETEYLRSEHAFKG